MNTVFTLDAYSPEDIAERVERYGVPRAHLPPLAKIMLGVVGGGVIGFGVMLHTLITGDPAMGAGGGRIIGGFFFAMGYLIAITAGAAVFTTNILMVMGWAARLITTTALLRSWGLVLVGNAIGAVGLVGVAYLSDYPYLFEGLDRHIIAIGSAKSQEAFITAFSKGVLGNVLICLGVWISMAGRSLSDKIFGPILPIAALPIADFEHSVGNLFYIPMALLVSATSPEAAEGYAITIWGAMRNLTAVTLGNVFGGGVMVALIYHVVYRRLTRVMPGGSDAPLDSRED
jgi:formate transporter